MLDVIPGTGNAVPNKVNKIPALLQETKTKHK